MYRFLFVAIYMFVSTNAVANNPRVLMNTTLGNITIELNIEKAPNTVNNFLRYVKNELYTETIFHRVIPRFMIQGGGYSTELVEQSNYPPIKNEADNGLKNLVGTIAMARTRDPHSATAQFFINVADNRFLNHTSKSVRGWGYAVFGKVIKGMSVVEKIASTPTGGKGPFVKDFPVQPVIIRSITVIEE